MGRKQGKSDKILFAIVITYRSGAKIERELNHKIIGTVSHKECIIRRGNIVIFVKILIVLAEGLSRESRAERPLSANMLAGKYFANRGKEASCA